MKKLLLFLFIPTFLYAQNEVKFVISGALQSTSVKIHAKLTDSTTNVRALVSTSNPPAAPFIYSNVGKALAATNQIASLSVEGLQPNTRYYYQIEADGIIDDSPDDIGTFKTPDEGPYNFLFMAASCNRQPDTKTYDDFLGYDPLFYLNAGDLHYADPNSNAINVHRSAMEDRVFTQQNHIDLFRNLPFVYVWDDHDYCGNDDDGPNADGAINASKVYKEYIPHYPFPENKVGTDTNSIYQAFTIGRVRFIVSDLRSQRTRNNGTAMGMAQKNWFKNELLQAKANNQLICWVSSYSWYGTLDDNWRLNSNERRELSEFMRDNAIENLFIINGDAHMFAIDDGSNGDFTAAQDLPYKYPVLQAGPIENNGSYKGGTYSEGTFYQFFVKAAQYGVVRIEDNGGDSICVVFEGYKKDLNTQATSQLVTYEFCRKIGAYIPQVNSVSNNIKNETELVSISPNPGNNLFVIKSENISNETLVRILDVNGKEIFRKSLKTKENWEINLSGYARGTYFISATNENGIQTKPFILQ